MLLDHPQDVQVLLEGPLDHPWDLLVLLIEYPMALPGPKGHQALRTALWRSHRALRVIHLALPALQWLSTQNPILGMKCELLCFARKANEAGKL